KENRVVSHRRLRWDFFGKNRRRIKDKFGEWCPWGESNPHSLRNTILSRARLPVPPHGHRGLFYSFQCLLGKRKIGVRVPRAQATKPRQRERRVIGRPCIRPQDRHIGASAGPSRMRSDDRRGSEGELERADTP